jgi:hypothetical protein
MSDKRISQLVERVSIANNDVLPIVALNAATTNKVTISTIQDWMQTHLDHGVTSIGITIGSTGTDISVTGSPVTAAGNITINVPTSSAANRGLLSAADWSTFNNKVGTARSISTTAPLQGGGNLSADRTLSITQAGVLGDGYLSSVDWNTFNNKQPALGYTPVNQTRQLTINGTSYDLSADRTWNVGTVTSIGVSMPSAFTVSGSPVTSSGTIAITGAGNSTQYIDGTGSLQTFPSIVGNATNLIREVYNNSGATMTKGTIIYINGGQGNLPTIAKALATGDSTSAQTYGVVREDIGNMSNGYITVVGDLMDMSTNGFAVGTQLYLSGTTAGAFTSTKPYAPIHLVYVGIVTRSHPTQGVIAIKIQNGYEMDELHNVAAHLPNDGDILKYVSSTGLWTKTAGSTTNITEGTNLYYTDARARAAISETVTGLDYNSSTGVLSTSAGYGIPTTASQTNWDAAYNDKINSAAVTGTTTKTLTLTQQDGGTITASWTDINTDAVTSVFGRTGAVVAVSGDYNTDLVTEGSSSLYFTNARSRSSISLTTTGTSGAATYNSATGVLNIPSYSFSETDTLASVTGRGATTTTSITAKSFLPAYAASTLANKNSGFIITSSTIDTAFGFIVQDGIFFQGSWDTTNALFGVKSPTIDGSLGTNVFSVSSAGVGVFSSSVTANSFIKSGGTSSQFLKANGSVDSNTYALSSDLTGYVTIGTAQTITGAKTFTSNIQLGSIGGGSATATPLTINFGSTFSNTAGANLKLRLFEASDGGVYGIGVSGSQMDFNIPDTAIYRFHTGKVIFNNHVGIGGASGGTYGQLSVHGGIHIKDDNNAKLEIGRYSSAASNSYIKLGANSAALHITNTLDTIDLFTITNTGNVGINVSNPTSSLEIKPSGATSSMRFGSIVADATYNAVTLNGTMAEGQYIGLAGGGGTDKSLYVNSGNAGNIIFRTGDGTNYSNRMILFDNGNLGLGTGSPNFVEAGRRIFEINGTSNVIMNFSIGGVARGYIYNDGTQMSIANYTAGKPFNFNTRTIAGGDTTKMTITSEGNVGIGSITPNHRLFVSSGIEGQSAGISGATYGIRFDNGGTNSTGMSTIHGVDNTLVGSYQPIRLNGLDLRFATSETERFRITSLGMVLFNTDTPSSSLGGTVVTVRASSSNAGQTAFSIQDYLKRGRWAFNGQNGPDNYDYAIYSAPNGNGDWTQRFTIQQDGVVYIGGTVSGGGRLQVNGDVNINGNFRINGTIIGGGGGSGVTGSGTANYITKWTSSSALGNSILYDSGSSIIIGGTSATSSSRFEVRGSGVWDGGMITLTNTGTGGKSFSIFSTNTSFDQGPSRILFYNGTDGTNLGVITNTGNWMFGTTTDNGNKLQVNGSIWASGDVIAFSDISVKKNIRTIENALNRVTKSRGVVYDRKDIDSINNIGFIAQELELEFPELITVNPDGTKGVKYQNAVAVLFEAIKEQQKQIDGLKKQIA